jgi:beta-galactosidase beta subunit
MFCVIQSLFLLLILFVGKLASKMSGEVHRNYLNVHLVLSASTDSHASFFLVVPESL